ncbi:MAG TPA: T9SS type B sorting domain-containing protein, partial [Bacteroides sp.]|nr:T9SS type B sorting domain-containing protein [Bacteroides sp.]
FLEPDPITIADTTLVDVDCNLAGNGSIDVDAIGGTGILTYTISPIVRPTNNNGIFASLPGGIYSVSITDTKSCGPTIITNLEIIDPPLILITLVDSTHVTCDGLGNGSIDVDAIGGTGSLIYDIIGSALPDNGTGIFSPLGPGNYSVDVTDQNGCGPFNTTNIEILNPDPITILSEDTTSITCNLANDGTITVEGQGGTGTLYYTLNPDAITNTTGFFPGIDPGAAYSVDVTDDNSCPIATAGPWDFLEPNPITIADTTLVDVDCNLAGNGSIDVDAIGGTGILTYTISPIVRPTNNNGIFASLPGGIYSVSVNDVNGCGPTVITNLEIIDPPPIVITVVDSTHVTCDGLGNGSIDVDAIGGTGSLIYDIIGSALPDNGTGIFSPLGPGNYSVDVTDQNGCGPFNTTNIEILNPDPITIKSEDTTSITCNLADDGTITVEGQGGTGTLYYTLNPDAITNTTGFFPGIDPGAAYSVDVTDDNTCPIATAGPWDFAAPAPITITDTTLTDVSCFGDTDGEITVTASGGTGTLTYSISPAVQPPNTSGIFSILPPDTYSVSVTDQNTCTPDTRTNLIITEPASVVLIPLAKQNVSCNGVVDGSITVMATGGSGDYTFSINPADQPDNNTGIFDPLPGGLYSVDVIDNLGCPSPPSGNFNVIIPDAITIDNEDTLGISCNGFNDAWIDITASGGTGGLTYILKESGVEVDTNNNGLFTNLPPGTYTVDVNDVNDCGPVTSNPFTFTEPGPVAVTVDGSSSKALTCYGDSSGTLNITVTGGYTPSTYDWTGPNGYTNTQKNISGLKTGDYNLTVTDAKGCPVVYAPLDSITGPPEYTMTITKSNITCFGASDDTVWVTPSGGTPSYMYDDGFGQVPDSTFINLGPGIHTIEVIDANSCIISDLVAISTPPPLVIVEEIARDSLQLCNGDSNGIIILTAIGGTGPLTYSIDSGYNFSINNIFTGLGGGTYYSSVMDSNGCMAYKSPLKITNPPLLYISNYAQDDIISCFTSAEGEARIRAAGGTPIPGLNPYIYVMDLADTSLTGIFPNLLAGPHDIDIYDANGCTQDTSIVILSPPPITFSTIITDIATCYEDSAGVIGIIASGGTGLTKAYIFQGDTTFSVDTVFYDSLPGGNYDFTVIDSLNCEVYPGATINSPDTIATDSVFVFPVNCFGDTDGEIQVYGSGGTTPYEYIMNPGTDTSATGIYTGLSPGSYTVTVNDAVGCKPYITDTLTVIEPPQLVFDSTTSTNISCGGADDGVIEIFASGGTSPYTYSVDTGASFDTVSVITGLGPGTYITVVMDASSCSVTGDTIVLADPPGLSLAPSTVNNVLTCSGDSTGSITVSATGGTGALEYTLDSIWQSSGTFSNLPAGIYVALVRDTNTCMTAFPADTVGEPLPVTATIITTTAMIPDSGSIEFSMAAGGSPPLEFSIDSGKTFRPDTFYKVVSEIYYTVVRDTNLCTYEEAVYVSATPPLVVDVFWSDIDCYNSDNGTITLAHQNGIGIVAYSILDGANPQPNGDFTGLAGASYYIHVTDSYRVYRDTVIIFNPAPFDVTATINPASCSRNSFDGSVSHNVSGATPPYTYLWSNDSITKDITGLEAGSYWVNITDLYGCQFTDTYDVAANVTIIASAGNDTAVCYGETITLNGSGGDQFTWIPEEGLSRADIANPTTTVTDSVAYVLFTRDVASGCTDRDTVLLTVHADRGISAGQDTTVAPGQTIILTATGGSFASYLWDPIDGLDSPNAQTTNAMVSIEMTYSVTGTTEFGCQESDSMNILLATGLKIYTGFTPNGDGINDVWDIDDIVYYPNATVMVYDRWGKLVFSSTGYADNQRWDGKYKGKEMPLGTYYYVIELKDGSEPYKGPVTIVR